MSLLKNPISFAIYFFSLTFTVIVPMSQAFAGTSFLAPEKVRLLMNDTRAPEPTAREIRRLEDSVAPLDQVITPEEQRMLDAEKTRKPMSLEAELPSLGVRKDVDLRWRDSSVKKQLGPWCTAYGLVGVMENALASESKIDLSEFHLWDMYQEYSASTAIKTALARKITDESYWPENTSIPVDGYEESAKTQLMSAPYLKGNIKEVLKALDRENPVYIAMRVPADMSCSRKVIRPNTKTTKGGHAIAVVGYQLDPAIVGGGYFILKNSWGADCSDNGYQYLAFHVCERNDFYCLFWEIESVAR